VELEGGALDYGFEMPDFTCGDFWREEKRSPEEKARMAGLAQAHRERLERVPRSRRGQAGSRVIQILQSVERAGLKRHQTTGTSRRAGDVLMFETKEATRTADSDYETFSWYGWGQCGIYRVHVQVGEGMEIVVATSVIPDSDACWFDDRVELFIFWLSQSEQRPYTTAAHLRYMRAKRGQEGHPATDLWTTEDLELRREILDGQLELAMRAVADRESSGQRFKRDPRTGHWYDGSLPELEPSQWTATSGTA
jgi:hypothetical protein